MVSNQATFDISSWDGTLSPNDFCIAASAFAEKWKKFNSTLPRCCWIPSQKQPWISTYELKGYLSLENVILPKSGQEDHDKGSCIEAGETDCSDENEPVDDAILVQRYGHEVHQYDFHIVYNTSYRVPVLYFRAYCSDGQPLVLDDIEKDLPANSANILMESKWTFITQEEHPYLNRPWYMLHPCGTGEWMKLLLASDASVAKGGVDLKLYLLSWFSVVGQVVGLKTPLEMLGDSSQLEIVIHGALN